MDLRERGTLIVREVGHRSGLLYRPGNELSERFVDLLRQTTLTPENVEQIKQLGFEVRVIRSTETEEIL